MLRPDHDCHKCPSGEPGSRAADLETKRNPAYGRGAGVLRETMPMQGRTSWVPGKETLPRNYCYHFLEGVHGVQEYAEELYLLKFPCFLEKQALTDATRSLSGE